jgi:hypothetical protein
MQNISSIEISVSYGARNPLMELFYNQEAPVEPPDSLKILTVVDEDR